MSSFKVGTGSSQSSWTLLSSGIARIASPTSPASHAHLHGPADRRPVEQSFHLEAYAREVVRQHVAHADQHALARLERLRHQEQLGKVLVLQLLVEWEIKARRAFADEIHDVGQLGVLQEPLFQALGLVFGFREG
jgi:hypothetical protein